MKTLLKNYFKTVFIIRVSVISILFFLISVPVIAATSIPLDDFTARHEDGNFPVANGPKIIDFTLNDGWTEATETDDNSILGGVRDISVELYTDSGMDVLLPTVSMYIGDGVASFSNDDYAGGVGIIQWNNQSDIQDLMHEGYNLNENLWAKGSYFSFNVVTLDQQKFPLSIEAYTDADSFTKVLVETTSTGPQTIPFEALENAALCGYQRGPTLPPGVSPALLSVTCGGTGNDTPVDMSNVGALQLVINVDASETAVDLSIGPITIEGDSPLACRLTGGAVIIDDDYVYYDPETGEALPAFVWDGETEIDPVEDDYNTYQIGGQVGAPTALPPYPRGEWTHHQQKGIAGSFTFHAGTASAATGTEITEIRCSDPGTCFPSGNPPSPNKQLDFDGIGTFKNLRGAKWMIQDAVVAKESDKKGRTFHWFEVNVDDNGEGPSPGESNTTLCPPQGVGEKGVDKPSECDCDDFYRITIYNGVLEKDVTWNTDADGNETINPASLDQENIIYEVENYLDKSKGNGLQLHSLTGLDRK